MIKLEQVLLDKGYTTHYTSDKCSSMGMLDAVYTKEGKQDVIIGLNEKGHAPTLKSHRHLIYEKEGKYYVQCNSDDSVNRMLQNNLNEVVKLICND